jgi:hypothetical protein
MAEINHPDPFGDIEHKIIRVLLLILLLISCVKIIVADVVSLYR